ncbi:MAG: tetratricopeptide repeat protein, partial [Tepidisphaeraceae bacterium]
MLARWKNSPQSREILFGAALVAMTFVAYAPTLRAGFIWDDDSYVTHNPALLSASGLWQIWTDPSATPQYYPLVHTTFWIEKRLWGLNPLGFHVVNGALHTLCAVLLWRLLRWLRIPWAWVIAAVFAVHPIQVESVAWVTERKNVLSTAFYLGAMLAYLRFDPLVAPARPDETPRSAWGLSLLFFVCAMLSKTVAATLPAALLLLIWWKRGKIALRDVVPLIPLFLVSIALGWNTARLEKYQVGAIGPEWDFSIPQRIIIAGRALWFYVAKLLVPWNLTFFYPRWEIRSDQLWQFAFPLSLFAVLAALWVMRTRIGRGPLVAVLYFVGTLVPALGFFDVYPMRYSFVADHFQYLACVGIIALVVASCADRVNRGVVCAVLAAAAVLTWRQCLMYRDIETLWRTTIAQNPDAWLAYTNLAVEQLEKGQVDEPLRLLEKALSIRPDDPETNADIAVPLVRLGRFEQAEDHARRAIAARPRLAAGHASLAEALVQRGRIHEAAESAARAATLSPRTAAHRFNLAKLLAMDNQR